jgi:hypothetical protein
VSRGSGNSFRAGSTELHHTYEIRNNHDYKQSCHIDSYHNQGDVRIIITISPVNMNHFKYR